MHRRMAIVLLAALFTALLAGAAVAASILWGVQDFAARRGDELPDLPVQQDIPQHGGVGAEASVAVTDAIWDGETVYITLHCQPVSKQTLLMDACLTLDMPVRNLDRDLPTGGTIGDWAAAAGYQDLLGFSADPLLNGAYPAYRVAWHMEEGGAYSLFYEFKGVSADAHLEVVFTCATWGWDAERGSFCDDDRLDSFSLTCTLSAPEAK